MDITIVTTTDNDDQARELLRAFGMPFRQPAAEGQASPADRVRQLTPPIRTGPPHPVRGAAAMSTKAQMIKSQTPRKFAVQHRNRCKLCGRPRAVYRKFGICRICFRNLASKGLIPGVKKASW